MPDLRLDAYSNCRPDLAGAANGDPDSDSNADSDPNSDSDTTPGRAHQLSSRS